MSCKAVSLRSLYDPLGGDLSAATSGGWGGVKYREVYEAMRRLVGLAGGMVTRASARPVPGAVVPLHTSLCAAAATSGDPDAAQARGVRRTTGTAAEATVAARGRRGLASDASTSGRGAGREDDGVGNLVSRLRADVLALWRGAEMLEAFMGKGLHGPKLLKMLRMLAESEAEDWSDDQQTLKVNAGEGGAGRCWRARGLLASRTHEQHWPMHAAVRKSLDSAPGAT